MAGGGWLGFKLAMVGGARVCGLGLRLWWVGVVVVVDVVCVCVCQHAKIEGIGTSLEILAEDLLR